jgi:hypothetical protein
MARTMQVEIPCPECEKPLKVTVSRGYAGTRWDPPEPPEIEVIEGCKHATNDLDDSPGFYDLVMEAVNDTMERAYDDHIDNKRSLREDD